MGYADILLMALIAGGAVYLLYRSIWKKRGYCHGCSSDGPKSPGRSSGK